MVLGPLNAIKQIAEIGFDWNVMLVRPELLVEEFVILRVLLKDDRVAAKKVRETICRHRPIDIHLVLVLTRTHVFFKPQLKHKLFIRKFFASETFITLP